MKPFISRKSAFSLVEITLALGVAGFCLIAIFGLLPVGLNSNQASIEQTAANGLISAICADLRATPTTNPRGAAATSLQYQISLPANPVGSNISSAPLYFTIDGRAVTKSSARYAVNITFTPNGAAKIATFANVKVSWPAQAATPTGFVQTFLALDRN